MLQFDITTVDWVPRLTRNNSADSTLWWSVVIEGAVQLQPHMGVK